MRKLNLMTSLLGLMSALTLSAAAQDIPAVTGPATNQGFSLPDPLTGGLRYALTGSESIRVGYYAGGETVYVTSLSGDLAYISANTARPTSLVYTGGYLFTTGQSVNRSIPTSSTFQSLAFSQGWTARRWGFNFGDTLQYLPQAPTTGLSGISGVGDVGIGLPIGGGLAGQDILTRFGQRVTNTTEGSVGRSLTGKTTLEGTGSYLLQRFVDNSGGLDSNGVDASGILNHRIDALNSVGGSYNYSRFSYPGNNFELSSQSVQAHYSRKVNRKLQVSVSGGPLKTSSNVPALGTGSWNVAASAAAQYSGRDASMQFRFDRRVRSGSGVVRGAVSTNVNVVYNRAIGRSSSVSADGGYTQNDSFKSATVPFSIRTILGAVQGRRALSRNFSAFVSYSVQKQILNGTVLNVNGYSGFNQVIGFGVTYSPGLIHLSHK